MENNIEEGQVWSYKNRAYEKGSKVTIIKIDDLETGIVVHLKIDGLKLLEKNSGKVMATSIEHLPISFDMFKKSVIDIEAIVKVLPNEGYSHWKRLFDTGEAGVWAIEIADAIEVTEETYQ